ncbi:hypothetical protein F4818DRAFT_452150 [Hypoxylon cercidicola]|nr:hypothetical protein F4818DRAFT_452150 [Hypoxylon cercidicola]
MADTTDYVTTLHAVSWVLGFLVIVVTIARMCGRVLVIRQTGWDDFFMCFGALNAIVSSVLVTIGVYYGIGTHQADIETPYKLSQAIKYSTIAPVMSIISSSSSKVSIFIFLLRLMGMTVKRRHLYFLWGLCILMAMLNLMAIVLLLRFCSPTAYQWDKSLHGTCIDPEIQVRAGIIQSGYNAFVDIILAVFPMTFITKLNISRKMKVGLCFMMGGTIFAAACTIVKAYLIKNLDQQQDITWYWASITLLYTAEMDVIIIVGTIPALWPLLKFLRRRGTSRECSPYKNASSNVEHVEGSDAYQLENSNSTKAKPGPVSRALQELDELRTVQVDNNQP